MSAFSAKDAVDGTKNLFNGKDPFLRLNGILRIVAFLLAMINLFGLQEWIDIDVNNATLRTFWKILSGPSVLFTFLCVLAVLQFIPWFHLHPVIETIVDIFETTTWVLVVGKMIFDFAKRPGISISCNPDFGIYLIVIGWFIFDQVSSQYSWNKWRVDSINLETAYYDANGERIFDGDIVRYNGWLYRVKKTQDATQSDLLLPLNGSASDKRNKNLEIAKVVNDDSTMYDLEIVKKVGLDRD